MIQCTYLGCSGISWKAYWGMVWNTSLTCSPEGRNLLRRFSTVASDASVRGLEKYKKLGQEFGGKQHSLIQQVIFCDKFETLDTHSMGKSAKSDVIFFCLGNGLVCFLNSVAIWPNSGAFLRVEMSSSPPITIASAAIIASRSVEIVRWSSGPASCRVRKPA